MKISRPCYDKRHRCPRRNGGGWSSGRYDDCQNGYVTFSLDFMPPCPRFLCRYYNAISTLATGFGRCDKCGCIVLPPAIQYVDPSNAYHRVRWFFADRKWRREHGRV